MEQVEGSITYNDQNLDSFVPERVAGLVPQDDVHIAKLTVQETLDFSARCQGKGLLPGAASALVSATLAQYQLQDSAEPCSSAFGMQNHEHASGAIAAMNRPGHNFSPSTYTVFMLGLPDAVASFCFEDARAADLDAAHA